MGNQQSMRYAGHDAGFKYEPEDHTDHTYKEEADASVSVSLTSSCPVEAEISDAKATRPPNSEENATTASTRAPKLTVETWHEPADSVVAKYAHTALPDKAVDTLIPSLPVAAPVAMPVRPNRRVEDVYDMQSQNIGRYELCYYLTYVCYNAGNQSANLRVVYVSLCTCIAIMLHDRGHYAVVCRGKCKRTGRAVAIKKIKRFLTDEKRLCAEISVLQKVKKHPNIVELIDVFETAREVQLVLELCTGGELFERLADKGPYSEADCVRHVRDMARAVHYLHECV